jgi:hypothetical protein
MKHTVNTRTLASAVLAATLIAILVLVSFILPAEYNIDPTGIGAKLGLTALATSQDTSKELGAILEVDTNKQAANAAPYSEHTATVIVPAKKGVEYKFAMGQYQKMTYEWKAEAAGLYFDLHGEPEGDTTGYFESYAIATSSEMSGSFTTPFKGSHGWYWKNNTDQAIEVSLTVKGHFDVIGLK